jgi:hypothetical protein
MIDVRVLSVILRVVRQVERCGAGKPIPSNALIPKGNRVDVGRELGRAARAACYAMRPRSLLFFANAGYVNSSCLWD